MRHILIDTDVILDFFFARKPFDKDAAVILSLCENKKIKGYLTPVIFSNLYYLLRKTAKHVKVIEKLTQLLSIVDILTMDKKTIQLALASGFKDFEDALQNFAAINNNSIEIIITRNVKDFKKSKLAVLTPENYIKTR